MIWVAALMALFGVISWIFVLVAMFQDEVWKGIVGILCGLYLLYYAVTEFDHEYKWLIMIGLVCGIAARFVVPFH